MLAQATGDGGFQKGAGGKASCREAFCAARIIRKSPCGARLKGPLPIGLDGVHGNLELSALFSSPACSRLASLSPSCVGQVLSL
jgi:hypothetical protein